MRSLPLRIQVDSFRPFFTAHIAPAHAAMIKWASVRRRILPALFHIGNLLELTFICQYGVEQKLCIWMFRILIDFLNFRLFYNLSQIHDNDPVTKMPDNIQIMRDK